MSESKYYGDGRPDWSNDPRKVVWNMLKRQRDSAREVDVKSDMIMQAIEVAPELEESMQVAFNLRQAAPPNMQKPPVTVPPR